VTVQKTQVAQSSPRGPPSSVGTVPITLCQWLSQDRILELWKSLTFNPKQSGLQLQLPVRNPPSIHPVHFLRPPRGRAGQHPRYLDTTMWHLVARVCLVKASLHLHRNPSLELHQHHPVEAFYLVIVSPCPAEEPQVVDLGCPSLVSETKRMTLWTPRKLRDSHMCRSKCATGRFNPNLPLLWLDSVTQIPVHAMGFWIVTNIFALRLHSANTRLRLEEHYGTHFWRENGGLRRANTQICRNFVLGIVREMSDQCLPHPWEWGLIQVKALRLYICCSGGVSGPGTSFSSCGLVWFVLGISAGKGKARSKKEDT
jgi:hypothetical protein